MVERAPDGLPIYELDDPEAAFGITLHGGGYVVAQPPPTPFGLDEFHPDSTMNPEEQA